MRKHRCKGLMNTISYNICGDGYDADVRAGEIFEKAKKLIDKAYKKGRADERAKVLNYASFDFGRDLRELERQIRADAIDEVIEIARAEIDFESQAEKKRFVEFMEQLKEQNNG